MNNAQGLGWKLVIIGLVTATIFYTFACLIHLSVVSKNIILAITIFVPMLVGMMLIYDNRTSGRSSDSAWHDIENSDHYL